MNRFLFTYLVLVQMFFCVYHIFIYTFVYFSLVDDCHWKNYRNLTDAKRRFDFVTVNFECDNALNGWYRFQGAASTKMVTTCPPISRCDTEFPIWLRGSHPTVAQGKVERLACINKSTCCGTGVSIQVKNCGSYYIYKLGNPGQCPARYCTTD